MRRYLLVLFNAILFSSTTIAQVFTDVTSTMGALAVDGEKDGGAVWGDFDNDGDLDVLVNTTDATNKTRLIRNDGTTFTDVTTSKALGLLGVVTERSAVWGDLNNDGYLDFVRNTYYRIEIFINRGGPDFKFGVDFPVGGSDEMVANFAIRNLEPGGCTYGSGTGMNAEGVGLIDYNNDGWLDLILESGECGVDVIENRLDEAPVSGSSIINTRFNDNGDNDGFVENTSESVSNNFFRHVSTVANDFLGLPETSGNGDFFTIGDYDGDGLVDVVVRKPSVSGPHGPAVSSVWKNNGNGTFSDTSIDLTGGSLTSATENDPDGGKGGVVMCDFDKDGDFDLFWSDAGPNQIWLQHPIGTFTPTGKPVIPGTPNIDGCACGDVDLDGDTDLFLGNGSGPSYLFKNTTTVQNSVSGLSFEDPVTTIDINADAAGVNLIDYNGDGDYDIYVNVNLGPNQLWENDLCNDPMNPCNFLNVVIKDCIVGSDNEATSVTRPAVGASVYLTDTNIPPNIVTAKVDGSTAMGHGAQNPPSPLIAIPDPDEEYIAVITFPKKGTGDAETYYYQFTPSLLTTANTLELTAVEGTDGDPCSFSVLPIELRYFTAQKNEEGVMVKWGTASELNNDYFILEKSSNGKVFDEIHRVNGNGTSHVEIQYSYLDPYPYNGYNYYRLTQYDYDGKSTKSKIIRIKAEGNRGDGIAIYPNPVKDRITINFGEEWKNSPVIVSIHDLQGNKVDEKEVESPSTGWNFEWNHNAEGFYWIKITNNQRTVVKKLVKLSP